MNFFGLLFLAFLAGQTYCFDRQLYLMNDSTGNPLHFNMIYDSTRDLWVRAWVLPPPIDSTPSYQYQNSYQFPNYQSPTQQKIPTSFAEFGSPLAQSYSLLVSTLVFPTRFSSSSPFGSQPQAYDSYAQPPTVQAPQTGFKIPAFPTSQASKVPQPSPKPISKKKSAASVVLKPVTQTSYKQTTQSATKSNTSVSSKPVIQSSSKLTSRVESIPKTQSSLIPATQISSNPATQTLKIATTQAPSNSTSQKSSSSTIRTSSNSIIQTPSDSPIQLPQIPSTQAPQKSTTQTSSNSATQTPQIPPTQTPPNPTIKTLSNSTAQTPPKKEEPLLSSPPNVTIELPSAKQKAEAESYLKDPSFIAILSKSESKEESEEDQLRRYFHGRGDPSALTGAGIYVSNKERLAIQILKPTKGKSLEDLVNFTNDLPLKA